MKALRLLRKKARDEAGQAIIEFLIVIMILFTMIFVFVQLSWAVAFGHYAHYATYMAARAYLSAGITRQDQLDSASGVLSSMLKTAGGQDLIPGVAKSRTGDDRDIKSGAEPVGGAFIGLHPDATAGILDDGQVTQRAYAWAEGVQYNFSVPMYIFPLATWVKTEGHGQNITGGTGADPNQSIEWKGSIPYTSDSFLGREVTVTDCLLDMLKLQTALGGLHTFIEDNGC